MQILGPKWCCSPFLLSRARTCPLISLSLVAYFRSTPTSSDKWKKQWFGNPQDFEAERPSKTYVRYKTRQKRADAKKALKDIYFGSGSSRFTLKGEFSKTRRTKLWDDDPTENKYKRGAKYWDEDPTESKNERGAKFWDEDPTESKSKRWEKSRDDDPTEKNTNGAHFTLIVKLIKEERKTRRKEEAFLKNLMKMKMMILGRILRQNLERKGILGILSHGKRLFQNLKNLQRPEINGGLLMMMMSPQEVIISHMLLVHIQID
ncbi:uncharacterized protein LOC143599365 [Bidens hawaiensis]|uniref:uncharacterized protein LOC143599365 n=1 Tax=Bidens hawaiensis TaxID=980011 RepID=UPI00404B19B9